MSREEEHPTVCPRLVVEEERGGGKTHRKAGGGSYPGEARLRGSPASSMLCPASNTSPLQRPRPLSFSVQTPTENAAILRALEETRLASLKTHRDYHRATMSAIGRLEGVKEGLECYLLA